MKYITSAVIITLTFWASLLHASPTTELKPFTATYEIDWNGSISLSGKTTRHLQVKDQHWLFESKANAMFASIFESSQFQVKNSTIQPLTYVYKRSVLGKKRNAEVHFDWSNLQVTNKVGDKPWQMGIKPGVQDKISYQLLLQQDVAAGIKDVTYNVADGGHLKKYRFKTEGIEIINAPIGEYEAIRVVRVRDKESERQTFIWFAPELNYQIIKLHQVEKKDKTYTLLLNTLKY